MNYLKGISLGLLAATALCAVVACSHSDEPSLFSTDRQISFEAEATTYAGASRSADITTTENIPEFRIWAYDYGLYKYLMEGTLVTRTGLNSWTYSPTVDWTGNMMCFTAVSPASVTVTTNPWWVDMIRYSCPGNQDLLVCRRTNVIQTEGRLKLHFYHALCMVDASLHTSLPPGSVRVKSVTIVNVSDIGQFLYLPEGFNSSATPEQVSECWEIYGQSNRIPIFLSDEGSLLTETPLEADNQGYDFFIPSRLGILDFDTYYLASYLEIDYRLENPDGSVIWPDASTDYRLQSKNNPGYGVLRIGLGDQLPGNRWLSGKRYRYSVDLSGPVEIPSGLTDKPTRSAYDKIMTVDVTDF